jgi:hypothetical protein
MKRRDKRHHTVFQFHKFPHYRIEQTKRALLAQFPLAGYALRMRIVGAWFSAIKQYTEFEQAIGNLLLRSDVCYAGRGYCLALASFNFLSVSAGCRQ